jgi:hypothetical protein
LSKNKAVKAQKHGEELEDDFDFFSGDMRKV